MPFAFRSSRRYRTPDLPSPAIFPLSVSSNGRHLQTASGTPLYLIGDSAWCLAVGTSLSEAQIYFTTRAAQGFNAVMLDSCVQLGASPLGAPSRGPLDVDGNAPFNGTLGGGQYDVSTFPAPGDTTSSAGKYWIGVDAKLAAAYSAGLAVLFNIYDNYSPWFTGDTSPNSNTALAAYGAFLGQRYANQSNIIWMVGNDFAFGSGGGGAGAQANLIATIGGVRMYASQLGWAFDVIGGALDQSFFAPYSTINSYYQYSFGPWRADYLGQYNAGARATFNIEAGYEHNTTIGFTLALLREEHYSFLLNGACGDTYGNEYVWPFDNSWQNWTTSLTDTGAIEFSYFAALVKSIPWHTLVPDQTETAFQSLDSPSDFSGAYVADGSLALAYRSSTGTGAQSIVVNMGFFRGTVTARWFDPTTGGYTAIGTFSNSGTHTFTSSSANASGSTNDFLLVLTA